MKTENALSPFNRIEKFVMWIALLVGSYMFLLILYWKKITYFGFSDPESTVSVTQWIMITVIGLIAIFLLKGKNSIPFLQLFGYIVLGIFVYCTSEMIKIGTESALLSYGIGMVLVGIISVLTFIYYSLHSGRSLAFFSIGATIIGILYIGLYGLLILLFCAAISIISYWLFPKFKGLILSRRKSVR